MHLGDLIDSLRCSVEEYCALTWYDGGWASFGRIIVLRCYCIIKTIFNLYLYLSIWNSIGKLSFLVHKLQYLIEAHVKTTDNYTLNMFCFGFTTRLTNQVKRTGPVIHSQARLEFALPLFSIYFRVLCFASTCFLSLFWVSSIIYTLIWPLGVAFFIMLSFFGFVSPSFCVVFFYRDSIQLQINLLNQVWVNSFVIYVWLLITCIYVFLGFDTYDLYPLLPVTLLFLQMTWKLLLTFLNGSTSQLRFPTISRHEVLCLAMWYGSSIGSPCLGVLGKHYCDF